MQCKVFCGTWNEAMDAFNKWAQGKALGKDVIVHTHALPPLQADKGIDGLMIIVIHPETTLWQSGVQ